MNETQLLPSLTTQSKGCCCGGVPVKAERYLTFLQSISSNFPESRVKQSGGPGAQDLAVSPSSATYGLWDPDILLELGAFSSVKLGPKCTSFTGSWENSVR
jgi:hypothetical protein